MHRLTFAQKAMLIKLWHAPNRWAPASELREITRRSLIRYGYLETVRIGAKVMYQLTQAGIRYNQTGKQIGE